MALIVFIVIPLWVISAIMVGRFAANHRNRSAFAWFLIAVLFSPLLGLFWAACVSIRPQYTERQIDRAMKEVQDKKLGVTQTGTAGQLWAFKAKNEL
jgi:hypothetical protein